jgi:uncharacterized protein (DUF2147 family)
MFTRTCTRLTPLPAVTAVASLLVSALVFAQGSSPAGRWRTIDDKSGQVKSIVGIDVVDGMLVGQVEKVFAPPAKDANPNCERCPGDRKNKPIVGMQILWGFRKDGDDYTGGRVFDPEEGKTYRGRIRVLDNGRKLELRGYVGVPMFGRSQTWIRE